MTLKDCSGCWESSEEREKGRKFDNDETNIEIDVKCMYLEAHDSQAVLDTYLEDERIQEVLQMLEQEEEGRLREDIEDDETDNENVIEDAGIDMEDDDVKKSLWEWLVYGRRP